MEPTPNLPAIRALRPVWSKGRIIGQMRPLKPKHVCAIRVRLELAENHRDLCFVQYGHRQQVARMRPGQDESRRRHDVEQNQKTPLRATKQDSETCAFRDFRRRMRFG